MNENITLGIMEGMTKTAQNPVGMWQGLKNIWGGVSRAGKALKAPEGMKLTERLGMEGRRAGGMLSGGLQEFGKLDPQTQRRLAMAGLGGAVGTGFVGGKLT